MPTISRCGRTTGASRPQQRGGEAGRPARPKNTTWIMPAVIAAASRARDRRRGIGLSDQSRGRANRTVAANRHAANGGSDHAERQPPGRQRSKPRRRRMTRINNGGDGAKRPCRARRRHPISVDRRPRPRITFATSMFRLRIIRLWRSAAAHSDSSPAKRVTRPPKPLRSICARSAPTSSRRGDNASSTLSAIRSCTSVGIRRCRRRHGSHTIRRSNGRWLQMKFRCCGSKVRRESRRRMCRAASRRHSRSRRRAATLLPQSGKRRRSGAAGHWSFAAVTPGCRA